jgi:hypothetical protein
MAELAHGDMLQLYQEVLCRYKDTVIKVLDINGDDTMEVWNLATQRRNKITFKLDDLSAPIGRIGFVNHMNWAYFVTRRPIRRYQAGISRNNLGIRTPDCANPAAHRLQQGINDIRELRLRTIYSSIIGEFPSLEEAYEKAKESQGLTAFDRQFAVSYNRDIYFRDKFVGLLPARAKKKERIVFKNEYEHLELLLNQDYEKTVRTFAG